MVAISPCPDEERHGARRHVARREFAKLTLDLQLALGFGQVGQLVHELVGRHAGKESIDGRHADPGEHGLAVCRLQGKITHQNGSIRTEEMAMSLSPSWMGLGLG